MIIPIAQKSWQYRKNSPVHHRVGKKNTQEHIVWILLNFSYSLPGSEDIIKISKVKIYDGKKFFIIDILKKYPLIIYAPQLGILILYLP